MVAVTIVTILGGGNVLRRQPAIPSGTVQPNTSSQTVAIPDFDSLKTYEKFRYFTFNDKKFWCSDLDFGYISPELIGNKIGEEQLETTDVLETIVEKENITIYEIENVSSELVIAVKFDKEEGCFLYASSSLTENTQLEDFLTASGLKTYASYVKATYSYTIKETGETATISAENIEGEIYNLFKKNRNIKNIYNNDYFSPYNHFVTNLSIKIVLDKLGGVVSYLKINEDGRSRFSLFGNNTFSFREDDVSELRNSIISKAEGQL